MSRQKYVYPTDEIAHLWAHKTQSSARNGRNFYFEGDTIYSYGSHFPIARHVEFNGKHYVLFTTRSYSATTAKHVNLVRRAVSHLTVFNVNNVLSYGGQPEHSQNVADYRDRVKDLAAKSKRARQNKGLIATFAIDLLTEANNYIDFFGLHELKISENLGELVAQAKEAERLHAAKLAVRRLEALKVYAPQIANWKAAPQTSSGNAEPADCCFPQNIIGDVFLRREGEEMVTSLGAHVPIRHAELAFLKVQQCRKNKEAYKRNGSSLHVGHYVIDRIDCSGTVHAGCHHITYTEIEDFARRQGWLNFIPEDETTGGQTNPEGSTGVADDGLLPAAT